jgi:hypothetical protein
MSQKTFKAYKKNYANPPRKVDPFGEGMSINPDDTVAQRATDARILAGSGEDPLREIGLKAAEQRKKQGSR